MLSNITNCLPIGVTPLERNSIQLSELIKRLDSVRASPIQLKQVPTPLEKPLTRLEQSLISEILELCRKAFEFIAENKVHKRIEKSMAGVKIATLVATDLGGEISTLGPAAMGFVAGWFSLDYIPEIIKQIEKTACSLNQQHLHDPSLQLFLASISGMAVGNLIASLSGAKKHSIEIASVLGSLCGGLGAITGDPAKYMEIITSVSIALGLITGYSTLKPFGLTGHFKINTLKLDPSSWIRLAATIIGSVVGTLLIRKKFINEIIYSAYDVLPIAFSATTAGYKGCSLTFLFSIFNAVDKATEGQLQQKIDYLTWPLWDK